PRRGRGREVRHASFPRAGPGTRTLGTHTPERRRSPERETHPGRVHVAYDDPATGRPTPKGSLRHAPPHLPLLRPPGPARPLPPRLRGGLLRGGDDRHPPRGRPPRRRARPDGAAQ